MPFVFTRRALLAGASALAAAPGAQAAAPPSGPRLIEARSGATRVLAEPAPVTEILGFDGAAPGPLLRYKQGDELNIRLVNRLDRPMSLHLQGMRGDNSMDGVAPLTQAAIPPGGQFDYRRVLRDPGLFIYRPSVFPHNSELMGRGLKGLLIVDEPSPLEADADIVLAIDAWRLDPKGVLLTDGDDAKADGAVERVIVNGKTAPLTQQARPGARVRLRLANLANAKLMLLGLEGAKSYVVAIDSQPCEAFEPVRKTVPAAPGARFELMFDMPQSEDAAVRLILRGIDGADQDILVITAKGAPVPARAPIAALPQNPLLPREIMLAPSKKVDLIIEPRAGDTASRWSINGAASKGYEGPPLFSVKKGAPVTLGFINRAEVAVVMHVHGHAVRLLHDLDDGWEPYWRNGVVVPPHKTKHVAFLADTPGKWALHDDILEHEASGLATWFEVA